MLDQKDIDFIDGYFGNQSQFGGRLNREHAHETALFIDACAQKTGEIDEKTILTLIRSGLGHDLIEDTMCTYEMLVQQWGEETARIIRALTNLKGDEKTHDYIDLLADSDEKILLVKFADIRSNLRNSVYEFDSLNRKWIVDFWIPLLQNYEKKLFGRKFNEYPKTAEMMLSEIRGLMEKLYKKMSLNASGCDNVLPSLAVGTENFFIRTNRPSQSEFLKKMINVIAYYALPTILFFYFISPFRGSAGILTGQVAEILLYATLFVKPLALVTRSNFLLKTIIYRRQMGVATFWFAFYHAATMLSSIGVQKTSWYVDFSGSIPYGIVAFFGLIILAMTSNDISVRYFRTKWKKIHFLAYPVLFLVLIHVSIVEKETSKFFVIFGGYCVVKYLELRSHRKKAR